jgi:hypothetical protein
MPIEVNPEDGQFSELIGFLAHSAQFLIHTIRMIRRVGRRNRLLTDSMDGLESLVETRSADVIRSVRSHDFDTGLREHGLDNESPDWRFKFGGYQAAIAAYDDLGVDESSRWRKVKKALKPMKTVLAWINVALRSITDAIPGVGGIYNEVKDGVEAAIDTVSDEPGAVKRAVGVLSPRRRRRHRLPEPAIASIDHEHPGPT